MNCEFDLVGQKVVTVVHHDVEKREQANTDYATAGSYIRNITYIGTNEQQLKVKE